MAQQQPFNLIEKDGDLFANTPGDGCLAHCVSEDLSMSKGIAVEFKRRFGNFNTLVGQNKKVGECAVLPIPKEYDGGQSGNYDGERFIYYIITKKHYWHLPTYESLEKALEDMRGHIVRNNVQEVYMPRIGSGLDKLDWNKVKECLKKVFGNVPVTMHVYFLGEKIVSVDGRIIDN